MWERSHMTEAMVMFSILLISFRIDPRPENKDIWGTARRRGKAWKAKAAAPTQQSTDLDAKPSTQSPHMLLWPAALVRLKSPAAPLTLTPHHQASHSLPPGFLVRATPVIYSFNDKTQTSHIHPLRAKIIPLELTTGTVTKLELGARTQTWICINPNSPVSGSSFSTAERKNTPSCEMQNTGRRRRNAGREFLSLQSPHRASTISSQPAGFNGGTFVSGSSSHAPFALGFSCFFFVDLHMNLITKYWHSFFSCCFFLQCVSYLWNAFLTVSLASISLGWSFRKCHGPLRGQSESDTAKWIQGEAGSEAGGVLGPAERLRFY